MVLSPVLVAKYFFLDRENTGRHFSNHRCPSSIDEEKVVLGNSETIFFGEDKGLTFDAKIDSGAEVSSLHATNIHVFTKAEKKFNNAEILFVRFKTTDDKGKTAEVVRMVSRVDQVKSASGITTRYFFNEKIFIHDHMYEVEVNLADRSLLSKKFLIGRNLLDRGYLIDTSQSYILTKALNL